MSTGPVIERVMRMGVEARMGLTIDELWVRAEREIAQSKKRGAAKYQSLSEWFNGSSFKYALLKTPGENVQIVRVASPKGLTLVGWSGSMPYVSITQ